MDEDRLSPFPVTVGEEPCHAVSAATGTDAASSKETLDGFLDNGSGFDRQVLRVRAAAGGHEHGITWRIGRTSLPICSTIPDNS